MKEECLNLHMLELASKFLNRSIFKIKHFCLKLLNKNPLYKYIIESRLKYFMCLKCHLISNYHWNVYSHAAQWNSYICTYRERTKICCWKEEHLYAIPTIQHTYKQSKVKVVLIALIKISWHPCYNRKWWNNVHVVSKLNGMGWVELGRTGETQIILYSRKEDNERMHSLRTNRQDETGSDQVFVNIVRIKKKREKRNS